MKNKSDSMERRGGNAAQISLIRVCEILEKSADDAPLPKQQGGELDGLVQNLLFEISRRRAWMEWVIGLYSTGRVRPRIRRILWWALAQIFGLSGLPPAVVVDTACGYAKKRYSSSDGSFVNAVLHKILEDNDNGTLEKRLKTAPEWVVAGLPEILWKRWVFELGKDQAFQVAKLLQKMAPVACRRRAATLPNAVPEFLRPAEGCDWCDEGVAFVRSSEDGGAIPLADFYIQDPSTLLAPSLMAARPGENVVDLCSAPGGKSLIMAEAMAGQGRLVCCDKSERRLEKVKENLAAFANVEFLVEDGVKSSLADGVWDGVLLDVPCSNTGVVRRRPDVRWTFSEEKLNEIMAVQKGLLERAARLTAPGGRIVYSTCSVERDENAGMVQAFLAEHPQFRLVAQRQLWPGEDHDGGYAALLVKDVARA